MSKLDIKNKTLTFDLNLSKRDEVILSGLTMSEQNAYLLSKLGFKITSSDIRTKISDKRDSLKDNKISDKPLIRAHPNHFLNLLQNRFQVGFKKPSDSAQYYGIEIECFIPYDSMNLYKYDYQSSGTCECSTCEGSGRVTFTHRDTDSEMEGECPSCEGSGEVENEDEARSDQAISDAKSFFRRKVKELQIKGLDVKRDGSLENDDDDLMAVEFTLLVRQDDLSDLEKLCKLLNGLGATVNESCGMHVHIDSRNKTKAQIRTIAKRFESAMPFLSQLVPKSRRQNRYCQLGVSTLDGDRYHAVNLTSFAKHGTVEVRLHSATTNFVKIKNWLKIVSAVYSNRKNTELNNWSDFNSFIQADETLISYIKSRVETFGGNIEESETADEINQAS